MESEQPETVEGEGDGLGRPVSDSLLKALYHERLLNPAAFFRAREILYPQRDWRTWILRFLLIIGSVLLLAGIVFFFAFNWAAMPALFKFGLIEATLVGCVFGAWKCKLDSLAGQAFTVAAAILVGVFLAVFGQEYPTGAEAYTLFGAWALLISIWVIVSRASAMWLLWIVLWNITLVTYWDSTHSWWRWDEVAVSLSVAGLNAGFLILAEAGEHFSWSWVRARSLRALLVLAIFGALLLPIENIIFSWRSGWTVESILVSGVALAGTCFYYRFKKPDLFALAAAMLFVCIVLSSLIFRFLTGASFFRNTPDAFTVLAAGLLIVGIFATAAYVLRNVSRGMPSGAVDGEAPSVSIASNEKEVQTPPKILTIRDLLERLQTENLLDGAQRDGLTTALFKSKNEKPTPWYLHAMVAIGAWLASLCFFGFVLLLLSDVFRNSSGAITFGLFWIGAAVFMHRTWESTFFTQLALAMSAAGHFMVLYGLEVDRIYNRVPLALASTLLCVVLNPLYRSLTHRFLSASLAIFWISVAVMYAHSGVSLGECILVGVEAVLVAVLFAQRNLPANLRPVGFALALALPLSFHFLMYDLSPFRHWGTPEYSWWTMNLIMGAMIAALLAWLTSQDDAGRKLRPLMLLIAVLGFLGGAGLLLGLGLMVLGYARRERELISLGVATLVSFLFFFYYNMQTDLLIKSMLLFGSGMGLLLIRFVLGRRKATEAKLA